MEYCVYIIFSEKFDKYYVGETNNVKQRLIWHNQKQFVSASTRYTDDWEIKLVLNTEDRIKARIVEKYIKSMKSKKFISTLISDKDFQQKFVQIVLQKFNIILFF
ncbi:MAG: GIY-YIG nuclease family protein [Bacteroidetes bacterium]|nr:GIY-YIG nuclease family protein [Bacteroidota bacterium]MBK9636105.1 GIY-YIG nuclease family protein [Bacteroidota bacterium]